MTYEEAHSRRNYAKPNSPIENFRIMVVPGESKDLDAYLKFARANFPKLEDSDAIPFASRGNFELMAFALEGGRVVSSECRVEQDND